MENEEFLDASAFPDGRGARKISARSEALRKPLVLRLLEAHKHEGPEEPEESEEPEEPEEASKQSPRDQWDEFDEPEETSEPHAPYELHEPYEPHEPYEFHGAYEPPAPRKPRKLREPRKPQESRVPRELHRPNEVQLLPRAAAMVISPSLVTRFPPKIPPSSLSGRCGGPSRGTPPPHPVWNLSPNVNACVQELTLKKDDFGVIYLLLCSHLSLDRM